MLGTHKVYLAMPPIRDGTSGIPNVTRNQCKTIQIKQKGKFGEELLDLIILPQYSCNEIFDKN